jgi:hypothetical protein
VVRKAFKSPFLFALCGVIITAAIYTHYLFFDFTKPANAVDIGFGTAEVLLCPPSLLFLLCIDCEVGTISGLQMWSLIALLNGGLYWLIAALLRALRRVTSVVEAEQ